MVKPIQSDILKLHFSKATLYALMANCLQFCKEIQSNPGNSGTSKTRAMVCELLAIKLLKEYSTRELIDALSYDFYPLQGVPSISPNSPTPAPNWDASHQNKQSRVARVSTLEIAIRAQAKRLLAHPLVVQQLEAIWAGTIVFHSAADHLHRQPTKVVPNQNRGYGAINSDQHRLQASPNRLQPAKQREHHDPVIVSTRRTVTLYDPRDASLFKLSRLRVPRYRSFFSTCSLAILLALFVAVLHQRSLNITTLEVIFWFWSAGFMLDEVVGFNEQGFSLYIMSFWNSFDLGILFVLICYYCLRLYGVLLVDDGKRQMANLAYDVLAVNAVLLFPRLFSVLDHYRYFSQLLIAFRMMAMDLMAVLVLILISCSGFFVAFTLSFGNDDFGSSNVAYTLFQLIMGFTPAAWDQWSNYNFLGKGLLVLFLFIAHFLIITILITVLTNSFLAIVQNANDEHQFLFAVNTISMVKSDALFSYLAPTNILAWLLTPLRSCIPFRKFVRVNRTTIKVTHFLVLFLIYGYERMFLQSSIYIPIELEEERGRAESVIRPLELGPLSLFSPRPGRLREPSVATFQKDNALDEVFRRPFRDETLRNRPNGPFRRKSSNVVNSWMRNMGPDGKASPPPEQDRKVVDRLERPRHLSAYKKRPGMRAFTSATKSIASDPEEFTGFHSMESRAKSADPSAMEMSMEDLPQQTDADGDDELATNDHHDADSTMEEDVQDSDKENQPDGYFQSSSAGYRVRQPLYSIHHSPVDHASSVAFVDSPSRPSTRSSDHRRRRPRHERNFSTGTMIYNPIPANQGSPPSGPSRANTTARNSGKSTALPSGAVTPSGRKTPKRQPTTVRARPIMPPRSAFQSAPNIAGVLMFNDRQIDKRRGSLALDLASDLGDNKAVAGGFNGLPASFTTQMAWAKRGIRARGESNDDQRRMGKLMLARMNTLEEGFREVIKEVKDWRKGGTGSASSSVQAGPSAIYRRDRDGKKGATDGTRDNRAVLGKKRTIEEWIDEDVDVDVGEYPRGSSI